MPHFPCSAGGVPGTVAGDESSRLSLSKSATPNRAPVQEYPVRAMMSDTPARPADPAAAAAAAADPAAWLAALDEMTAEEGYLEPMGPHHWAFFTDAGTTLLVTFETMASARARPGQMPFGHAMAAQHGWSHLALIAEGDSWFRDKAVWGYFDRLVDDAFFEDFDRVLFYGAGMGGYAACAYSVVSPGADVLAISPQATLDPAETLWDRRFPAARRLDFTSRYGYAPEMTEGAGRVTVIYDPQVTEDAMHAALFRAAWVTRLKTRFLGDRIEAALISMGLMDSLLEQAMSRGLGSRSFAALWRRRRDFGPYLRALLEHAEATGRTGHEIAICRSVTRRLRAPRFARRLRRLTNGAEGA